MSVLDCASVSSERLWTPTILQFDASSLALAGLYAATIGAVGLRLYAEAGKPTLDKNALQFWAAALAVLLILFANRLFNLQFLATLAGRCEALGGSWYYGRRPLQFALIAGLGALGLWGLFLVLRRTRAPERRMAIIGLSVAIVFIAIRAVSFHWVEAFLRIKLVGLSLNGLTEGAALGIVLLGAIRDLPALLIGRFPRATPRPSDRDYRK